MFRACEMEEVRFAHNAIAGLTPDHYRALAAVAAAAGVLAELG